MTELVNCVLQCSGCDIQVTEDDIRDPDNCQNRLTDIQGVWQDVSTPSWPLLDAKLTLCEATNHRLPPHLQVEEH